MATSSADRGVWLREELLAGDQQFRDAMPVVEISRATREAGLSLARTIERVMTGYADRPAVAERRTETVGGELRTLPVFETKTYSELWAQVKSIVAVWSEEGLRSGDFVAMLGFCSSEYLALEMASMCVGTVSVSLQPSSVSAQLQAIVDETAPALLVASVSYLDKAVELALASASAPRVMVFDYHPDVDAERAVFDAAQRRLAAAGRQVDSLARVLARAAALPEPVLFEPACGEDPLGLLSYTSGSTGVPRGAMFPQSALRRVWASGALSIDKAFSAITVNYMPMSHGAGRNSIMATLCNGGTAYFSAKADLSTLFEDVGIARPTLLATVPRVFDMLFQEYQRELARRADEFGNVDELDAAVKADIREHFLGGRILYATVGGAPIGAEMKAFAEACLDLPLHVAYGTTEVGPVLSDNEILRPPVVDYKLVDVLELGYLHTDQPHPRGELLVKSEQIFLGYYRRPDVTASMFDEDGYFRTGDIMVEYAPGKLAYLDRRNSVQKLSQGEFVSIFKVESVLTMSPLVRQIYVHGSAERAYLLAVVVPTEEALRQFDDPGVLKDRLTQELRRMARDAGLASYEVPRDVLVETEPFSMSNQLLSDIGKLLRPRLREKYGGRLEELYVDLARGEADELSALRSGGVDQPVYDVIARAAKVLLGCASSEVRPDARFSDLGGDSLSALSFAQLLRDIYGIDVQVSVLLDTAGDLRSIAEQVQRLREDRRGVPDLTVVHGHVTTEVRATDLTLDKFLEPALLDVATRLPRPEFGVPRTVLLTGATGYLGRFLCLDWLERLAQTGGTLVCLVRGADEAAARKRLDATFETGDPTLWRRYDRLATEHLEVLAGDLSRRNLGLSAETWHRVTTEVDMIVHVGALVNHMLPYAQLFGPNVVGTAELIGLALTEKIKPFVNVSTLGVRRQIPVPVFDETTDIRVQSPVRMRDEGEYASGYSTSKWAGEVLLREAHDHCGLPVSVFRCDMILAHERYTGQLNEPDMFTRLMFSLIRTRIAPRSFYRTEDGQRPRAHYDGLTVGFVAEAIGVLGARSTPEYRTYHVLNPHDDGISLDTYVDWLIEAGFDIARIDDYADWLSRFESVLRTLPESERGRSSLPLLHSFAQPAEPVRGGIGPAEEFRAAVRTAGIGVNGNIPHVTPELIVKYITDLEQLGLL